MASSSTNSEEENCEKAAEENTNLIPSKMFVADKELKANDVLFGRGAAIIGYEGNVHFRELVQTRKYEYNFASCHTIKGGVAKEIYQEIKRRKGRFLQRIHTDEEARTMGVPKGIDAWKLAPESDVLEKIKQTLRDKTSSKFNVQHHRQANRSQLFVGGPLQRPSHGMLPPSNPPLLAAMDTDMLRLLLLEQQRGHIELHGRLSAQNMHQPHLNELAAMRAQQERFGMIDMHRVQQRRNQSRVFGESRYRSFLPQAALGKPHQDVALSSLAQQAKARDISLLNSRPFASASPSSDSANNPHHNDLIQLSANLPLKKRKRPFSTEEKVCSDTEKFQSKKKAARVQH